MLYEVITQKSVENVEKHFLLGALKRIKKVARQKSVENVEKHFVLGALKRNQWNVTRAAEETGMQRSNFQALMAKYDIRIRSTESD